MTKINNDRSKLLRACYSFLVPVARFLLRTGISYNEFAEVSRMAFIKVGLNDYGIRGRPTNTSRLAAMTGISRREVTRLRDLSFEYDSDPRAGLSPIGDVLHHWYTDPRFLESPGTPKELPFSGSDDSFEALVTLAGTDVPIGAMKVELIRCGAVREAKDGFLRPTRRHAVPEDFDMKLLTSLAFNLRALASNIAHNSNPERRQDEGWIERFVQSRPLTSEQRSEVRLALRQQIEQMSEQIDDSFSSLDSDLTKDSGRVGVGLFYYEDE